MPAAFIYFLKLSVSLGVVFLFYQLVLRRLTFYNWNRWYLLGYTLLSFIIPLIDITPALHQNELTDSSMVQWVPLLYKQSAGGTSLTVWNILFLFIIIGMLVMLIRLLIQLVSFRVMMKKAVPLNIGPDSAINLYQVNESIIPFSFGNAVFINRHLHTAEELEEIIRHEFVHVKERHSIDIILGELLCLFNWYNPFAWFLKSAIRQNLEFVADNKVLENGINKKQYQYLLLKVIGNNQFSIAQKFNFSSLKKRIAMMNKNKSAKMHLLRFLFVLPVLAFILLSFRKEIGDTLTGKQKQIQTLAATYATDTVPEVTVPNNKGYFINVKDRKGECLLVIKDKTGKEVKRLLLTEWNANAETFEETYGKLPPPPPPPPPPVPAVPGQADVITVQGHPIPPVAPNGEVVVMGYPNPPKPVKLPEHVKSISIKNGGKAIVELKNGKTEKYDLNNPEEKKKFDARYPAPPPPPPPPAPGRTVVVEGHKMNGTVSSMAAEGQPLPDNLVYVINGVISTKNEMEKISPDKIATVDVLKGNSAIALYGEIAKDGVVQVRLKNEAQPLYVIDGVISSKADADKINAESILTVDVLKGEAAEKQYGGKGKNGVIIIRTKNKEVQKPVTISSFLFPAEVKKDQC